MKKYIISILIILFTFCFGSSSFASAHSYSSHSSSYSHVTTHYHTSTPILKPIHHSSTHIVSYKPSHVLKPISHYKAIKPLYTKHATTNHRFKL